jgi:tRNA dimethylallyltransferase
MNKLIVILGPTASGKTNFAIKLAKEYNGEVVSADSRQIYKGMDIGTAKPLDLEGIPHWLLDIKKPDQEYTVAQFKEDAVKAINDIQKRGKLAILAGGTGLYIKAVVDNLDIPKVRANPLLRKKIEKEILERGLDYVFKKLINLDPEAAYIVDPKNPRRIARALEITLLTKKPFSVQRKTGDPLFNVLEIGMSLPKEKLKERIYSRVNQMMEQGLVKEVEELVKKYGAKQQAFDAIGYREIIDFLNKKTTQDQATELMKINTWHFAKRQMTWFKKDKRIVWVKDFEEAKPAIDNFLDK